MNECSQIKSLDAKEKVKLILWLNNHKEQCETLTIYQLTQLYRNETGSDLSESSIQTYRNNIYPKVIKQKDKIVIEDDPPKDKIVIEDN